MPDMRGPDRRLGRFLVVPGILLSIGLLVIYPVFFLITESLNLGESGVFPPTEIGFGNDRTMAHMHSVVGADGDNSARAALDSAATGVMDHLHSAQVTGVWTFYETLP